MNREAEEPAVLRGPLALFLDDQPRPAALNMAVDEALLEGMAVAENVAVLRVYRWARPAVSFGYFEPWAEVRERFADGVDFVRRWTGGGIVEHGDNIDWTYSLLLPRRGEEAVTGGHSAELYRTLHAALTAALRTVLGWEVELVEADRGPQEAGGFNACFTRPVRWDVRLASGSGKKIAGAAQRRTRAGLLHQGSVRAAVPGGVPLNYGKGKELAAAFARRLLGARERAPSMIERLSPAILMRADELNRTRYQSAAWMQWF